MYPRFTNNLAMRDGKEVFSKVMEINLRYPSESGHSKYLCFMPDVKKMAA
jgi:hypothetical protein